MAVANDDKSKQTGDKTTATSADAASNTTNSSSTSTNSAGVSRRTMSIPLVEMGMDYEEYKKAYTWEPKDNWPPPIFLRRSVTPQERFYLENRWYSQWAWYDAKAQENKKSYFYYQNVVIIGGVIIPTLVSINPTLALALTELVSAFDETVVRTVLDMITVIVSLAVAMSAAYLGLQKFGENWASYRAAAEELQSEKSYYDMGAGPYLNNPNALATFVERTENIIAKQNGNYFQTVQKQIEQAAEENKEYLDRHNGNDDDLPSN